MPKRHEVQEGECIQSLAERYGFLPDTLWQHPDNQRLVAERTHPSVLNPGDVVVIPDKRESSSDCATGRRHVFKRRGVPVGLKLRFSTDEGEPRKDLTYRLLVAGKETTGTTDADGVLEAFIPSQARDVELLVEGEGFQARYALGAGALDPVTTKSGVAARLVNLDYLLAPSQAGAPKDAERALRAAIRMFQEEQGMKATGKMDPDTEGALVKAHGY